MDIKDAIANLNVTTSPESRGSSIMYDGTRKRATSRNAEAIGINLNPKRSLALAADENLSNSPPNSRQKQTPANDASVVRPSRVESVRHSPSSLYMIRTLYWLAFLD